MTLGFKADEIAGDLQGLVTAEMSDHSGEKCALFIDKQILYVKISPRTSKVFHTENIEWSNFSICLLLKMLPVDLLTFIHTTPRHVLPRDREMISIRKLANRTGFSMLKREFFKG
jgi:hypothetical protein